MEGAGSSLLEQMGQKEPSVSPPGTAQACPRPAGSGSLSPPDSEHFVGLLCSGAGFLRGTPRRSPHRTAFTFRAFLLSFLLQWEASHQEG